MKLDTDHKQTACLCARVPAVSRILRRGHPVSALRTASTKSAGLSGLEEGQRWDGPNYTTRGGCGLHRSHLWETRKKPADVLRPGEVTHSTLQTEERYRRSTGSLHAPGWLCMQR